MFPSDFNPELDLELIETVPLTPNQLFNGWTDSEILKIWFCPRPWRVIECTIDLRVGGLFSNIMQSPEGNVMPENKGCYLFIEKPNRLVWTGMLEKNFRPNPVPQLGFGFVCDLSFEAQSNDTTRFHAIVKHSDREGKEKHEQMGFHKGWRIALAQLVDYYKKP